MNVKPVTMHSTLLPSIRIGLGSQIDPIKPDNLLTVRENDELIVSCVVESSRPAAKITFNITDLPIIPLPNIFFPTKSPEQTTKKEQFDIPLINKWSSVISTTIEDTINVDRTIKTVSKTRLKVGLDDNGKTLMCKAENDFSNQKWQNKKKLNVLFAPVCQHPPNYVYYVGINQTLSVECHIRDANPSQITYQWDLGHIKIHTEDDDSITKDSRTNKQRGLNIQNLNHNGNRINLMNINELPSANKHNNGLNSLLQYENHFAKLTRPKTEDIGFTSRFKWRPTSLHDFGKVKCRAHNEVGSTECVYQLKLGGIPNPPNKCTHMLKNTSAIISCQVGYHQGDPDIYCYLLRKNEEGIYKEHTRNRESCSFIVNDVNVDKLNEFWIYSSNKHGDNKDSGVHITIGHRAEPLASQSRNRTLILIGVCLAVVVFLLITCCLCFKMKKGLDLIGETDNETDNDSSYRTTHSLDKKHLSAYNSSTNYQVKLMKGAKISQQMNSNKQKNIDDPQFVSAYDNYTKYNKSVDYLAPTIPMSPGRNRQRSTNMTNYHYQSTKYMDNDKYRYHSLKTNKKSVGYVSNNVVGASTLLLRSNQNINEKHLHHERLLMKKSISFPKQQQQQQQQLTNNQFKIDQFDDEISTSNSNDHKNSNHTSETSTSDNLSSSIINETSSDHSENVSKEYLIKQTTMNSRNNSNNSNKLNGSPNHKNATHNRDSFDSLNRLTTFNANTLTTTNSSNRNPKKASSKSSLSASSSTNTSPSSSTNSTDHSSGEFANSASNYFDYYIV
jgi:hypothetical protein